MQCQVQFCFTNNISDALTTQEYFCPQKSLHLQPQEYCETLNTVVLCNFLNVPLKHWSVGILVHCNKRFKLCHAIEK